MQRNALVFAVFISITSLCFHIGCSTPPCGESTNGITLCGETCTNLETDVNHCGSCNTKCKAGELCKAGKCQLNCQDSQTECNGSCVDTKTNASHCGSCGTSCKTGELCVNGSCAIQCKDGQTDCSGTCVDTQTDINHCGSCGSTCNAGEACTAGKCEKRCPTELTKCGDACVDTKTSRANCGACGTACKDGEVCSAGTCALSCQASLTECNKTCVDTKLSRANCGACGTACKGGEVCSAGTCALSCQTGLTKCSDTCVDTQLSRSHCGACGTACKDGEVCSAGTCTLSCQQGLTDCSGTCVNTQSNRTHCGACGTACKSGEVCDAGTCKVSCPTDQTLCNNTCTNTKSDRANCGACGTVCKGGEVCSAGTCALSCQTGLTECNKTCVDTKSSRSHCGACGTTCKTGEICTAGACVLSCPPPFSACGQSCVNTSTDSKHCGACNSACTSSQVCNQGICQAKPECLKNTDCPSGRSCVNQKCVAQGCNSSLDCPGTQLCNFSTRTCYDPSQGCNTDADCPGAQICNTSNGRCTTRCLSDADCPGAQICNTSNGKCTSSQTGKKVGEECGQQVGNCATGLQCVGTSLWGKFYCFTDCKTNPNACPTGTTCIAASSTISVCAKEASKGDACDYAGSAQALCKSNQKPPLYCSPRTKKCIEFKLLQVGDTCGSTSTDPIGICDTDKNLTCSNNKCVAVKTVGKYDPCGGSTASQCSTGLECVNTSNNSGHCFTQCTVSSPSCATGETCQALQTGGSNGVCIPSGSLDYGIACGVDPNQKYDVKKLCKQSLSCVNFGRRICIELQSGTCQSYQCKTTSATCVDLSAGSSTFAGCFRPCTKDADCTTETFCRTLQGSSGNKVCWPKNPPGDVVYGGVCKSSPNDRKERCKSPGTCLQTNPESGFCSTNCNTDNDCAAAPGGSGLKVTCAPISQANKLCVFDCSASGATCPTGLTCEDIQGSKLCVPPTPVGPNPYQSKCDRNQPIAQSGCAKDLTCFGTSQATGDGLCSKNCISNTDCAVSGSSVTASCVKGLFQDPNVGLCAVSCGQPGQTCPSSLQCRTLGSNTLCLP